jgi:hypothetical protein
MKRILTFLVLILLMGSLSAQKNQKGKNDTTAKASGQTAGTCGKADEAPYKSDPKIPAFNIMLPDSTWFTKTSCQCRNTITRSSFISHPIVAIASMRPRK